MDSRLDWGQGILEVRDFRDAKGVEQVALSYFGSAPPEACGIVYTPIPSCYRMDPFASYRDRVPYRVLGHHLFVFDEEQAPPERRVSVRARPGYRTSL